MKTVQCDLCSIQATPFQGPAEITSSRRLAYGIFRVTVKRIFWHGLPFGVVTKRLDICHICADKLFYGIERNDL